MPRVLAATTTRLTDESIDAGDDVARLAAAIEEVQGPTPCMMYHRSHDQARVNADFEGRRGQVYMAIAG